jgi:hypothetical protein
MLRVSSLAFLLCSISPLAAQTIGGNATLSISTITTQVALPAPAATYPALMISEAIGDNEEVFFALGTSGSVTASNTSTALPSTGLCIQIGANITNIAAVGSNGTGHVYVSQWTRCPVK